MIRPHYPGLGSEGDEEPGHGLVGWLVGLLIATGLFRG